MTGFRQGSRRSIIADLDVGESHVFEAPLGKALTFMQQVNTDCQRLKVPVKLRLLAAVSISAPRELFEQVRVTRLARKRRK